MALQPVFKGHLDLRFGPVAIVAVCIAYGDVEIIGLDDGAAHGFARRGRDDDVRSYS